MGGWGDDPELLATFRAEVEERLASLQSGLLALESHASPRQVVAGLKEIDPDHVVPMHCTGEPFYEIAKAEMPGKLLRSFTGTRFVFNS